MRINNRKLYIWRNSYLVYKYLWPNLTKTINKVVSELSNSLQGRKLKVIDVGCGNKPYKDLFEATDYIGMDYNYEDTSADIIGTADNIPFNNEEFDIVFSTQVMEHVPSPEKMLEECFRVLKHGGYIICSAPFAWPIHEAPYDFTRFSKYGIQNRLENAGFKNIVILEDGGTWACIFVLICVQIPKWLFPLRIIINIIGTILDKLFFKTDFPSNYTFYAQKTL